ncbi:hypothetical protein CF319_g2891 [Tilletia indica]|nr:hypothetical protein CF319_g2891 [Tilletia indica]
MGSAGVDLRAAIELHQTITPMPLDHHNQNDPRADCPRADCSWSPGVYLLSTKVHSIAAMHGLGVEPDVLNYVSLTTHPLPEPRRSHDRRSTPSHLVNSPCTSSSPLRLYPAEDPSEELKPMHHEQLISDPTKQLSAIEKAGREEEPTGTQALDI